MPFVPHDHILDPKIAQVVKILQDNGVETCQSYQGGRGHSYDKPTPGWFFCSSFMLPFSFVPGPSASDAQSEKEGDLISSAPVEPSPVPHLCSQDKGFPPPPLVA